MKVQVIKDFHFSGRDVRKVFPISNFRCVKTSLRANIIMCSAYRFIFSGGSRGGARGGGGGPHYFG